MIRYILPIANIWNKIFGLEATFSIAVEDHQNVGVQKLLKSIKTTQKQVLYFNYSYTIQIVANTSFH